MSSIPEAFTAPAAQPATPFSGVPGPPANWRRPADRQRAEALSNQHEPVEVIVDGVTIAVLPARKWKASGLAALQHGDAETWAYKSLTPEGFAAWQRLDPDFDQVEELFRQWSLATGQSAPELFASPG